MKNGRNSMENSDLLSFGLLYHAGMNGLPVQDSVRALQYQGPPLNYPIRRRRGIRSPCLAAKWFYFLGENVGAVHQGHYLEN